MVQAPTGGRRHAIVFTLLCLTAGLVLTGVVQPPADAAVTSVEGSACGYITDVGLFGGPQGREGCPPQTATSAGPASLSPSVVLPAGGSASAVAQTDADGAKATYGPAAIFAGIWPLNVQSAPPSGPISVSTQGTPAGGTVTSSADIVKYATPKTVTCATGSTPPCTVPGGFGPGPVEGDELHATCTASATSATGSATFKNGKLTLTTTADGSPLLQEPIPDSPPVNYTRSGVITNVGDVFSVVFNQQFVNADKSLTVNAVHMYLFGPTAVGEMIEGQTTCGTAPSPLTPTDTLAPGCGKLDVEPMSPTNPTPMVPRTELIGVFDAGGLQTIGNIQSTNATVRLGNPASIETYLHFVAGQTGPLPITATQIDQSKPMSWSFDATDKAGNVTHSSQCPTDTATVPTTTTQGSGSTTTQGSGTTTTSQGAGTTTTQGAGTTTTTTKPADVTVSPSTVEPGGTVEVTSVGWEASSEVTGVLHSDPVTLGTLTADASGTVNGSFTIPTSVALGAHSLELTGTGADGAARSVSTTLTVDTATTTTIAATGGSSLSGAALARTGLAILRFLAIGGLLLGLGAVLTRSARRGSPKA